MDRTTRGPVSNPEAGPLSSGSLGSRPPGPGSAPPAPSLAVVVVTWNARDQLARCLEALVQQEDGAFDIVVVDNASTDGTGRWVRRTHPRVRLVACERNLGFAEACNRGIAASRTEWVVTLNDDAVPDPGWLRRLRDAAAAAPAAVGMLQSDVRRLDDPERVATRGVAVRRDGVFEDAAAGLRAAELVAGEPGLCVSAAAAAYRRCMLDELALPSGVFDRGCFAYFEDVDLGWRARLAGWDALLVPGARVLHAEHASAERAGAGFLRRQCRRNRVRVLAKNASGRLATRAAPRLLKDALGAAAEGPRELIAWLSAACDGLRQRPAVTRLARVGRREVERRWIVDSAAARR